MTGGGNGSALPLAGVRVIDFSQVMLGPCATQMLGDFGADVIKIERPGSGDLSRWAIETDHERGDNPVFCSLNRNKRSHQIVRQQRLNPSLTASVSMEKRTKSWSHPVVRLPPP